MKHLIILCVLFPCHFNTFSQVDSETYSLKLMAISSINLPLAPLKWDANEKKTAGLTILSGAALTFLLDMPIRKFNYSIQTPFLISVSKYGVEPWGRGLYSLPVLGGLFFYGKATKHEKIAATSFVAVETFVVSSAYTFILKQAIHRERPYQSLFPFAFHGPFASRYYTSMPSGHTQAAFSVASVFARSYKEKKWVAPVCYTLASLVGISRIYDNKHWLSDVVIGAALGTANGLYFYNKNF